MVGSSTSESRAAGPRFPNIRLWSTPSGELARLAGHRLWVFRIVLTTRALGENPIRTAEYYQIDRALVDEALDYAHEHRDEIEQAIAEEQELARVARAGQLPGVQVVHVTDEHD